MLFGGRPMGSPADAPCEGPGRTRSRAHLARRGRDSGIGSERTWAAVPGFCGSPARSEDGIHAPRRRSVHGRRSRDHADPCRSGSAAASTGPGREVDPLARRADPPRHPLGAVETVNARTLSSPDRSWVQVPGVAHGLQMTEAGSAATRGAPVRAGFPPLRNCGSFFGSRDPRSRCPGRPPANPSERSEVAKANRCARRTQGHHPSAERRSARGRERLPSLEDTPSRRKTEADFAPT